MAAKQDQLHPSDQLLSLPKGPGPQDVMKKRSRQILTSSVYDKNTNVWRSGAVQAKRKQLESLSLPSGILQGEEWGEGERSSPEVFKNFQ